MGSATIGELEETYRCRWAVAGLPGVRRLGFAGGCRGVVVVVAWVTAGTALVTVAALVTAVTVLMIVAALVIVAVV